MYLAAGGEIVRLYDTDEYNLHQKFKPLTHAKKKIVRDIAWSPNGKYFGIIVDADDSLEVTKMGEMMEPHESIAVSDPNAIAFPKQSTGSAAVGTKGGVIHTVDYINKKALVTFPSCGSKITSMDYSSTDTTLAVGTTNGKIFIVGVRPKKIMREFSLPTAQVVSQVKYHNVRRGIMAASSHEGDVIVWDTNFNSVDCKFSDHTAQCTGVVFSPYNKYFMATVGFDYCVYCYDMRAKRQVLKARIPAAGTSLDCHKNGNILAVSTVNGIIDIFDLRNTAAPVKEHVTKGRTIKILYQLEPEVGDSRKSSSGKASSLERLVHKRNSSDFTANPLGPPITETCVSVSEESRSSDDSSLDSVFSPIRVKSPMKPTNEISSQSSLSLAVKQRSCHLLSEDLKTPSSALSKKGSPAGHSLTCNNSEEFVAGLLRTASKTRAEFGHLCSINETGSEEKKLSQTVENSTDPKIPLITISNGHSKDDYKTSDEASKLSEVKLSFLNNNQKFAFPSPKKGSPSVHGFTCNTTEEFAANLVNDVSTARCNQPRPLLGNINEMSEGEETKFQKSTHDLIVLSTPQMPVKNGHQKDSVIPASPKESGHSDHSNVIEEVLSTCNREEEDELSEVDTSDLLQKYSITRELGKECDVTLSLNQTNDFRSVGEDVAVVQAEEGSPKTPVEDEARDEACAVAPMPSECLSTLKEYIDDKYMELIDVLHSNCSKMHLFNMFINSKEEIMLEKILKILEKQTNVQKVDKCVGTR
ncbi:uncharacterized protein LOC124166974 [Ischnura elegans]|uniref:uncharacterized protein LOC124166974 n=1 Tax=Ischnura elegans TaxID=197161 RepID=UPI001ED8A5F4|nr:uncharacterized protein LOC124166974 [Ischnura elegans]